MSYEFSPEGNREIAALARFMGLLAYACALGGALQAVYGVSMTVYLLGSGEPLGWILPLVLITAVGGVLVVFLSFFLRRAARQFDSIVSTEGQDIEHLMSALGTLTRFFRVAAVLLLLLVLALILAVGQSSIVYAPHLMK